MILLTILLLLQFNRISTIHDVVTTLGAYSTAVIEIIGILIIALLSLYALGYALYRLTQSDDGTAIFHETRYRLIRGVLLGLDFLVAADIIRTVAVELTFSSIGVLAIIVVIRILLSFTLEVEMTGFWPWEKDERPSK